MKKLLCILLSLVMVMSLFTACGDDSGSDSDKSEESSKSDKEDENDDGESAGSGEVLTYTKLMSVMEESAAASTKTTASFKFDVEAEDLFDVADEEMLSAFGWTAEKMSFEMEMSVVVASETSGKMSMNLYTGEKKELIGIDNILVVEDDIYIETAEIYSILDSLAVLMEDEAESLSMVKDYLEASIGDKKYISVNLTSLMEMVTESMSYEDVYDEYDEYYSSAEILVCEEYTYDDEYLYEDEYAYDDEYDYYDDEYDYYDDSDVYSDMTMEEMMEMYTEYAEIANTFIEALSS